MSLGENEAALQAGQRRCGQPVDIGFGPECTRFDHGRQAATNAGLPAVETGCEHDACLLVPFSELTEQVGDRATSPATELLLEPDKGVRPPHQPLPGVEAGEKVLLRVEHR